MKFTPEDSSRRVTDSVCGGLRIHCVPILAALSLLTSSVACYIIACLQKHVHPFLPLISEVISIGPEHCLFSLVSVFSTSTLALSILLRLCLNCSLLRSGGKRWLAYVSAGFGLFSTFGVAFVANFSESEQFLPHVSVAILLFLACIFYSLFETLLTGFVASSRLYASRRHSQFITAGRSVLFVTILVGFLLTQGCGYMFLSSAKRSDNATFAEAERRAPRLITPSHPAYDMHLCAAASEWLMMLALVVFIGSFALDLRHVRLTVPRLVFAADTGVLAESGHCDQLGSDACSDRGQLASANQMSGNATGSANQKTQDTYCGSVVKQESCDALLANGVGEGVGVA